MVSGHCTTAIHAEINCILRLGQANENAIYTLYVTHLPCPLCIKFLKAAKLDGHNIVRVVYDVPYRQKPNTITSLQEVGIAVEQYNIYRRIGD